MSWSLLWRGLRLAFLLRVPLATLLILAGLGPIARFTSAGSLLDNLFDQGDNSRGTFLIAWGAYLLAYAAVTTLNLILHYGADRFPDSADFPLAPKRQLTTFVLGTLAPSILMVFVVWRTEAPPVPHIGAAILGAFVALSFVAASKAVQLLFTDRATTPHPPPYLIFPAYRFPRIARQFDKLYCRPAPSRLKTTLTRWSQWPLEILRSVGQGYLIYPDHPGGMLNLRSGHVFAFALGTIAFFIYLVVGLQKYVITELPPNIPALAFLMLFCNVACWALSALTFFFDRYRFPLFWTLAALATLTASAPESDHFFRVETGVNRGNPLTPADYLARKLKRHKRLIFVATPGGGIQAAAWTTKVLNELSKTPGFDSSLALISSVSGGSLGSLVYTAKLAGSPLGDPEQASMQSAIDEVAWGWTFPDFWRAVLPWVSKREIDRGWALEEKWIAVNKLGTRKETLARVGDKVRQPAQPVNRDVLLSDWAARNEDLPALVFNSMLVESGQHVVFSTTNYPKADDPRHVRNFYDLYPRNDLDVRVATAARLSASFPYVAPAARPDLDPFAPAYHFVDGGYFDNIGIDSLIGWLTDAQSKGGDDLMDQLGDILILEIRHFPENQPSAPTRQGWFFQTHAPLSGLLSMWNAAPLSRDANELKLFANLLSTRRCVYHVTVPFNDTSPGCAPLSWKLSSNQKACITNAWKSVPPASVQCVQQYLETGAGKPTDCQELK